MHFLLVWMLFLLGIEEKCKQGREISGCDAISLTGFGLILTLRTDYTFPVLEHSFSKIFKRQRYSNNACTCFYLLRIFVHEK
jgi:hypothetical protein